MYTKHTDKKPNTEKHATNQTQHRIYGPLTHPHQLAKEIKRGISLPPSLSLPLFLSLPPYTRQIMSDFSICLLTLPHHFTQEV